MISLRRQTFGRIVDSSSRGRMKTTIGKRLEGLHNDTEETWMESEVEDEEAPEERSFDETLLTSSTDESLLASSTDGKGPSSKTNERRVRFSRSARVKVIPKISHYTEKQRRRIWLSREEKKRMGERLAKAVARMEALMDEQEKDDSERSSLNSSFTWKNSPQRPRRCCRTAPHRYRGLEGLSPAGAEVVRERIELTIHSVLDEQDRQWTAGIDDPLRIAATSMLTSMNEPSRVMEAALVDEEEAASVYSRGPFLDEYNDCLQRGRTAANTRLDIVLKGITGSSKQAAENDATIVQ